MQLSKDQHDISQIFLVYMALVGDAEKTALALDLELGFVTELARKEGWASKVQRISVMSKSGVPGDWERAQNRALNFVQCHQLRRTVDRVIAFLSSTDALDILRSTDAKGIPHVSARVLTDTAKAMEMIHSMTYTALGDSPKERTERSEGDTDAGSSATMHAALIAALNHSKLTGNTAEKLVADAVTAVEELKSAKPQLDDAKVIEAAKLAQ